MGGPQNERRGTGCGLRALRPHSPTNMTLHLLPTRAGSAAENMAVDFLLLQRYPGETAARFRHYGWHRPAFTFGYSQKIEFVRDQLPRNQPLELCRRATGGG